MGNKGILLTCNKIKELGIKGFFKKWGDGIDGVTPLQTTKVTMYSFIPILFGITYGIIFTILKQQYWVTIILCGSLPLTIIQVFTTYQKLRKLKKVEETLKMLQDS